MFHRQRNFSSESCQPWRGAG